MGSDGQSLYSISSAVGPIRRPFRYLVRNKVVLSTSPLAVCLRGYRQSCPRPGHWPPSLLTVYSTFSRRESSKQEDINRTARNLCNCSASSPRSVNSQPLQASLNSSQHSFQRRGISRHPQSRPHRIDNTNTSGRSNNQSAMPAHERRICWQSLLPIC